MRDLYRNLTAAYSDANLNQISAKLISLYKDKKHEAIREISNQIADITGCPADEKTSRCFSNLIRLYHPDKGPTIRKEIVSLYQANDHEALKGYSHILRTAELACQTYPSEIDFDEDIGYQPEYQWDEGFENMGFQTYTEEDFYQEGDEEPSAYVQEDFERSFYNLLKLRVYGSLEIEFPSYYLHDFEEIEMADSDLDYLDGIQYCKHAKVINLSGNRLSDLAILYNMKQIEELYLADNQIMYTEILGKLPRLKSLDISNNEIEDISPLFQLNELQYLNVIGNQIPKHQIEKMQELGVMVVS